MKKVKLREIAELITKGTTPTTLGFSFEEKGIRFYKIESFNENGNFNENRIAYISEECNNKMKRSCLQENDILFSIAGALGRVAIVEADMLPANINQALAIIRIKDEAIYLPYIKLILSSNIIKKQIQKKKQGVAQLNLSLNDIKELEIPIPNKENQIVYVQKINKIRDVLLKRKEQLKIFDELIQSRFVEEFGDLKINPKKWKIKTFDEMTDLITDGEHATPRRTEEGIYLLSARNIMNHTIKLEDVDYIDQAEYDRISKRIHPKEGDVLISCSGTVGRCCSVPAELKFQMVRSVALLRFKNEINPIFAEYMITSDYLKEQIDRSKTQSSQANLFQGKIKKLKGFVPPIDLQNQFAAFVQQINKSKFEIQKSLEKTQLLFDSLMQEYFG